MAESPVSRFTYRAFISYSHRDKAWADWLHCELETWRVPSRLIGTQAAHGVIPRSLRPIFRDREELASATDLGEEITDALDRSECLIVICSPASAASPWVNEEVLAFKHIGRGGRILCLIVDGEPNATSMPGREAEECFCPALRFALDADGELSNRRAEPIAADIRPGHDSKPTAKLRLIAGMLGVGFDTLIQREAHRRRRRALLITAAALLGMAIASVLAINAVIARNEARQRQAQTEQALNYMLGDLHDKLKGVGRLDLMASVTDKALALFAASKPGSMTDDELTQQSRALVQIGQIRLDEAQYAPAMDAFRRADQRSVELTTRYPDNGRFLFDRAQAEYWIGYVYWQQRKLTDANEWWTRYRDSTLALVKIDPHNHDWQREASDGEHNLAVLALDRGDLESARHGFETELAKKEELARREPGDADLASQVADTTSWLGNVAEQRGDLAGAQRLFGEQARQLARLRALHPEDFHRLSEWASAQELLAASLATTGRNAESQNALGEVSDAYLTLTKHDPNNIAWRVNLANVQVTRATYAFAAGHADQGEALLSPALEQVRELVASKASQGNPQIHRVLSRGWLLRARIAWRGGDLRSSREAAERSLTEAQAETTKDAVDDGSMADRAEALLFLGTLQQAQSQGAMPEAWTQAHTLLATRAPDSHYWRLLDPWRRVCRLTGDDAGARIALDRLNASGYVPLQPWPASAVQPFPVTEGDQHVH
ncbi:MAG TPA: toll/interleukin-1 receptor domain-containing protein [Rhodanobacteraceae bacterium]|nr:toll/interleukin-1 receptor domain-containing protein [Rhodanobacteraceae bacterium]